MKTTQMSINSEWINKIRYIHIIEHYSAIKKGLKYRYMIQHGWTIEHYAKKNYAKWKKPDTKGHKLYDSI